MEFQKLNLQIEDKNVIATLNINNQEIKVYDTLLPSEQFEIINQIVIKSYKDGVYNPFIANMLLDLYIITFLTDITLTKEDWEDVLGTYDRFYSSGLIKEVTAILAENKIFIDSEISKTVLDIVNSMQKVDTSAAVIIKQYAEKLPQLMQEAADIVNNFDPAKYQAVIDFATAANGNRPV